MRETNVNDFAIKNNLPYLQDNKDLNDNEFHYSYVNHPVPRK